MIYPNECPACGKPNHGRELCAACRDAGNLVHAFRRDIATAIGRQGIDRMLVTPADTLAEYVWFSLAAYRLAAGKGFGRLDDGYSAEDTRL
jgi:hypothetical protein